MRQELLMPKLGLTMTEGTLAEWSVAPGAAFRAGDTLMVIESDKVTVEVPAESDGVLIETRARVGDVVSVGSVVGYVQAPGDGVPGAAADATAASATAAQRAAAVAAPSTPVATPGAGEAASAAASVTTEASPRIVATPLARRLASNLGVDLRRLTGSGPRGRIRADDVKTAAAAGAASAQPTAAAHLSAAARDKSAAQTSSAPAAPRTAAHATGALAKPTSIQATMARRLTLAKQQIPHFYLAAEAEVSQLLRVRAEINAARPTVKLTLNHLVVAAVARSLRELPEANRVWTEEGIHSFAAVDVGVAVNTERGLLVPVVRDIAGLPLAEIAARTTDAVDRARQGALRPDDMGGGAITVSNAGMHEVTWMTPIINPGTAMILGVGSIREAFRPDEQGQPALRREMGLVLAADHRLVDGVAGLTFLNRVIAHLRHPVPLLYG